MRSMISVGVGCWLAGVHVDLEFHIAYKSGKVANTVNVPAIFNKPTMVPDFPEYIDPLLAVLSHMMRCQ